jgi:hypothetical protein
MKKLMVFVALLFITCSLLHAQSEKYLDPDHFLIGDNKVPKVLLVGSFHFRYPGLDAHKTKEEDRVNIFSPRRQAELKELLDYIAQFKPTKIVVESGPNTGYLLQRYRDWKSGERQLGASETEQIAIRLLDRFGLDTLYGADAFHVLGDLYRSRDTTLPKGYVERIAERHYFGGDDELSKRYDAYYEYDDRMTVKNTLLETFMYMNSDKALDRGFGAYITGGQFVSEENEGPDALSMFWFNRNLRIFRNIQRIGYTEDDRILVLFGAGHIAILKYLFECTPEYELIEFEKLSQISLPNDVWSRR